MRALILSLFAAGALALTPTEAKADHYRGPYNRGYYGNYRPYNRGYYNYYRPYGYRYDRPYSYGYYRPYYGYPYSYGYPYRYGYYGYPRSSVGFAGPAVSFWYGW